MDVPVKARAIVLVVIAGGLALAAFADLRAAREPRATLAPFALVPAAAG